MIQKYVYMYKGRYGGYIRIYKYERWKTYRPGLESHIVNNNENLSQSDQSKFYWNNISDTLLSQFSSFNDEKQRTSISTNKVQLMNLWQ